MKLFAALLYLSALATGVHGVQDVRSRTQHDDTGTSSRALTMLKMMSDMKNAPENPLQPTPVSPLGVSGMVGDLEVPGGPVEAPASDAAATGAGFNLGADFPSGPTGVGNQEPEPNTANVPGQNTLPSSSSSTTLIQSTFLGFNYADNILTNADGFARIPPDACGAAGKSTLVGVVNSMIEILDKDDGSLIARESLQSFFGAQSGPFDPKVIFDNYEQRFVVVALLRQFAQVNPSNDNESFILLAVSKDGNPQSFTDSDWNFQLINSKNTDPSTGIEYWADYPGFEDDGEALYITNNMFAFPGSNEPKLAVFLWIIDKGANGAGGFYEGTPDNNFIVFPFFGIETLMPAKVRPGQNGVLPDGGVSTFLVAYGGYQIFGQPQSFILWYQIFNPLTNIRGTGDPTAIIGDFLEVGVIDNLAISVPGAAQLDSDVTVITNDRRSLDAVWQNNSLYFTSTVANFEGLAKAHWFQLDTTGGTVTLADQGDIDANDIADGISISTSFASVAVNNNDQVMFGFSASGPSIYPGAYAAGRNPGDDAGTVRETLVVKEGLESYVRTFGGTRNRYGDYSSVDVDPSDNETFWIYNEYAETQGSSTFLLDGSEENGRWGTAWGRAKFCDPTGGLCLQAGRGGGAQGDPHFKTWTGLHFDYHGECDLVLLRSETFESGLGLDVHIRTQIRHDMSFISSAVLRIGTDVLEVASQGVYYLNGVAGAELPNEFSGFPFTYTQPSDKQRVFDVHLGGRERIKIKTYKDLVSVLIEQGQSKHFGDSAGLMGDFEMGRMLARDGETVLNDHNAFGQEWQVLDIEPTLFQTVRLPRHPQVCTLPPPKQESRLRRRLSESTAEELAAEQACAHWGVGKDDCIFDVMATGDLEMAMVGAY